MASLMRLGAFRNLGTSILRRNLRERRGINTSSGKTAATNETCSPEDKNWISFGYCNQDPFIDRLKMHVSSFLTISCCLVGCGIYLVFVPDPGYGEWAQREAYLELRRRESQGLLPIDPDYHDPRTINLPSDEELGDTEIII